MNDNNPGFGGFMNGIMPTPDPPRGAPPGPTEQQKRQPPRMKRNNRPDIEMARNVRAEFNDSINIDENYESVNKSTRPEMKGPGDLGDILNGLKTKKINLKEKVQEVPSVYKN